MFQFGQINYCKSLSIVGPHWVIMQGFEAGQLLEKISGINAQNSSKLENIKESGTPD